MSDAALAALPADFPFRGTVYKVHPRTLGAECHFQTWLEREALLALARHREILGEDEYDRRLTRWQRDCAAKVYAWGKEAAHAALFSREGMQKILWLKIEEGAAKGGPHVAPETVAEIAADPKAWEELVALMMRQDFPDPNPPAGAAP